jgi:hypothetical protein
MGEVRQPNNHYENRDLVISASEIEIEVQIKSGRRHLLKAGKFQVRIRKNSSQYNIWDENEMK